MTTSTKPRGICPACGREMQLKVDGTVRHHGGEPNTGIWLTYRSYRCNGSGQKPVTDTPKEAL